MFAHSRLLIALVTAVMSIFPGSAYLQEKNFLFDELSLKFNDSSAINALVDTALMLREQEADNVIPLLKEALIKSWPKQDNDHLAKILFELGLSYQIINDRKNALLYYKASLYYMYRSKKYNYLLPGLYSNIGYIFFINGDYTNAISYYKTAVNANTDPEDPKAQSYLITALNNMAAIQVELNRYQLALYYLNQAEHIGKRHNITESIALTTGNKGFIYEKMGDYTKAEQYYSHALKIYSDFDGLKAISNTASLKSDFAGLKLKQGKAEEAIALLKDVKNQNYRYLKEKTSIMPDYVMGMAFLQLRNYPQAEHYLSTALKESQVLNVYDNRIDIYEALSQLYDSVQNFKQALYYHRLYEQLKNDLISKEKARDIGEIEIKFRVAEKNKNIARQQLKINKQQNSLYIQKIWITGFTILIIILVAFFIVKSRLTIQRQRNQERQIQIMQQQQEINHLNDIIQGEEKERVRIARELHDGIVSQLMGVKLHLKGALKNAGSQLTNRRDFENTLQYLSETTNELRKTAHNLMPEIVLQRGLVIALITHFENMAFGAGIPIHFQHFGIGHIHQDIELSLYRIIQELVQNALKHSKCSQVLVEICQDGNHLSVAVEDDGIGLDEETVKNNKGMGLKSIFTRVHALKGDIEISRRARGTAINIELTINEEALDNITTL